MIDIMRTSTRLFYPMTFERKLTFAQPTDQKTWQWCSIMTVQTSSYQFSTSASYSNVSFMPRRRNSITVAAAESQRPSFSAIDASTDTDGSRSVMPPLQSTPPPAHIWVDHNRRPHPFIEEGGKRRLMCFEVEGTVVDYFLKPMRNTDTILPSASPLKIFYR